jgi:N-acetylmuramoyl-L-alanine amidase
MTFVMKKRLYAFSSLALAILCFSFVERKPSESKPVKVVNYSIFGSKYAVTPIIDSKLANHVYYVVSGHGGPDPGAVCKTDKKCISEDEYAYDISLRLARNLISHGAKVYMIVRDENDGIRDDEYLEMDNDETVWMDQKIPGGQIARLRQRTTIINKLYEENAQKGYQVQRVIETHVDSRYVDHKVDIFFYYNDSKPESQQLAHKMYDTIRDKYDSAQKGRGYSGEVKSRELWMIQASKPPVVFIELGNITNEFDRKRLLLPNNRQAIANWFAAGIEKHSEEDIKL